MLKSHGDSMYRQQLLTEYYNTGSINRLRSAHNNRISGFSQCHSVIQILLEQFLSSVIF